MAGETYRFDEFELDTARFQLRRSGEPVAVEPRAFDVLIQLIEHRDRVVSKQELLDSVWGSRFVSEAALTTALRTARRVIGDSGREQRIIRTSHGRGYQFEAPVSVVATDARVPAHEDPVPRSPAPEPTATGETVSPDRQQIRFCHATDGVRIAYATVGSGPVLLKAANWIGHLDLKWDTPV